ncbi:glycoside hydrolase family 85 protein [Phanerochaete carnosa HHB-10118-sp]|uniref:Glycoside hydrolase family 85 protein n=1 Tax=Phanerochaete carnosa (strain HHB-10118-sp) TaxID=650164 RepID=K5X7X6_PHACS|nr:glycoside hydrolase family 85 protein [Phanerochaete carnosa HHB-10118-sp]EKM58962.1 glycoside hydrolase family 85 protein [Phanerochaete carnosa HHB-10118-sp]
MPLRGTTHSHLVGNEAPYFQTLQALDDWASTPTAKLTGCLPYIPRSDVQASSEQRGKLLVCHDYKGGYTEKPDALAYTFNFWSHCDTFIYFAHNRVTIPPSGWINAAHRQGVKMLGTLIFEHAESEADCLRLLVGRLPQSTSGPARPSPANSLPASSHYARLLANLAYQRGFDGYLLNFEAPLRGGVEQTRALTLWIGLLERELKRLVGEHAQVVWYDSVIINGQLRWQDRLNAFNLPFFLPSTSFFTNYTWPPQYPSLMAQYFLTLDIQQADSKAKQLRDIFVGVDVWGRNQHGGGGLSCYKALTHIDPQFLGLSVALFGQGWSWESEQDKPGWSWDAWWAYERTLWVGPADPADTPDVEDPHPPGHTNSTCAHGPYKPVTSFFALEPPPNPARLALFTSFSPGVGRAWFVEGRNVWDADGAAGWTDLDKTCALGDLLWPRPALAWHDAERAEALPAALPAVTMDDAWLGGSAVRLMLSVSGSAAADAFFRCLWLPVQSLAVTPGMPYILTLVYKEDFAAHGAEGDIGLLVKPLHAPDDDIEVTPLAAECGELAHDWRRLSVRLVLPLPPPTGAPTRDVACAVGLVLGFATEDPTQPLQLGVTLGALAVHPALTPSGAQADARLIWADFARASSPPPPSSASTAGPVTRFAGVLTWEVGEHLGPLASITLAGPDDPKPAWPSGARAPAFAYFNVYVIPHKGEGVALRPEDAAFIGTTGLDGRANRFYVDPACLPRELDNAKGARFYVQGVTDRATVLRWEDCVYVDVSP